MRPLTLDEIFSALENLEGWELDGQKITKIFACSQEEKQAFKEKILKLSERMKHEIIFSEGVNDIIVQLSTDGHVTDDDIEAGKEIELAAPRTGSRAQWKI